MNQIKRLVLVKWEWPRVTESLKEQMRRTCRLHQCSLEIVDKNTPHPVAVHMIRDADYVVVWNGSCPLSTWAVDVRKILNKHVKIIEVGWFTQREHWHFDDNGIGGKSTLCGELEEPTQEDLRNLENKAVEYTAKVDSYPIDEMNLPEGYILCPLQVTHDVTVYYDAPFKLNSDFMDHVIEKFPDDPIVFKTHPKQRRDRLVTDRKDVYLVRSGDFIDYTPNAKLVYGQTSTTLVESALVGVDVEAIGNCPLFHHQSSKDEIQKLLAHLVKRQVDRKLNTDLWTYIVN